MSRFNKRLPFFEESSEKRDVESWNECLGSHFLKKGMKVIGIVSDRAKALIKLGASDYLNACSMPDLFHFQQDIGKLCGLQIGKKHQQGQVSISAADLEGKTEKEKLVIEQSAQAVATVHKAYRSHTAMINKIIHPFDEFNNWSKGKEVTKVLLQSLREVSKLAESLNINIDIGKAAKVLHQIPDIVEGIRNWISISEAKINTWITEKVISETEKNWLVKYLLPFLYWHFQLRRTKNGRSNPDLVAYYENRMKQAKEASLNQIKILNISKDREEVLFELAYQMASSFQRSSSQVEGRNGYLAFIHHAQKGIPQDKMRALTVTHNFDTKRADGSTPAQRLFQQDFPDLFEFLCQNVTGFKEPRRRKAKSLKTRILQR